jgi:hypothetical protein
MTSMKRKRKSRLPAAPRTPPKPAPQPTAEGEDRGEVVELAEQVAAHPEGGPELSAGDVDADWIRASHSGDEAVGGSVATPDQDIVDEIGSALGVAQPPEAEVRTSEEILRDRDRFFWHLEREAARTEEEAEERRPRTPRPG